MAPLPRRLRYRETSFYPKIIRLEGQIQTTVAFLLIKDRLLSLHGEVGHSPLLKVARRDYLNTVTQLTKDFLDKGLDLVNFPANLGALVRYVCGFYFGNPDIVSAEEKEKPYHWPKILFFQALQAILEDEKRTIGEALAAGWRLYLDANQYPVRFDSKVRRYKRTWDGLHSFYKMDFLGSFWVERKSLEDWLRRLERTNLRNVMYRSVEGRAPHYTLKTFFAGSKLDIFHPILRQPRSHEVVMCPICFETPPPIAAGTREEHRQVQTSCGHSFGYSCVRSWLAEHLTCPMCRKDLQFDRKHCPKNQEVLQSLSRLLDQVDASRPPFLQPQLLCLDAFLDIFRPASEVWDRLRERKFERPDPLELDYWARVSVFLARDRLKAVVEINEDLFRRVLRAQALVLARSAFLLFVYQFQQP